MEVEKPGIFQEHGSFGSKHDRMVANGHSKKLGHQEPDVHQKHERLMMLIKPMLFPILTAKNSLAVNPWNLVVKCNRQTSEPVNHRSTS